MGGDGGDPVHDRRLLGGWSQVCLVLNSTKRGLVVEAVDLSAADQLEVPARTGGDAVRHRLSVLRA
jgi:hypothetical protein